MKKSCLIILVKALNFSVNAVVASCLLLLFACGCYKIYDSHEIYQRADSDFATYQSPGTKAKKKMVSFDKLKKLNPDVFGWLEVEGTNISYPVLKCSDNLKYVNTDVKGKFSLVGGIFLDCRNKTDFSDKNNIIHGHHMDKNRMFGGLDRFRKKGYFKKHKTGWLYYEKSWHKISFFAFVEGDAYDSVLYGPWIERNDEYLRYVKGHARRFRRIKIGENDRFVTLSTCKGRTTNGRSLLIGKIEPKRFVRKDKSKMEMVDE